MSKNRRDSRSSSLSATELSITNKAVSEDAPQSAFSSLANLSGNRMRKLIYPILGILFIALLVLGIMGKNRWLPHTDSLSGKRTGWFGRELGAGNINGSSGGRSSTNNLLPFEPTAPLTPTSATPQLSKEYIYAGSRMLAVEDANASAAPPTDLAVWRRDSGTWYVKNSTSGTQTIYQFGLPSDTPVRGDFDGDGKTDFCVHRNGANTGDNSNWYSTTSSTNQFQATQLGIKGDTPVPADYDGDGRTDIAVFRPATQIWYILRSSDVTIQIISFGTSGDKPVPADYDGDGKADVAQYRKSTADWYMLLSGNGNSFSANHFGLANVDDNPVTGDYDGDGKYDLAVWRPSDNTWYINNSAGNTTTAIQWGDNSIDQAVQGDFDADGKTDIAVWRNSGSQVGLWQIRNSSTGQMRTDAWGTNGDIPVPAPYRR